jgi:serine/threonine-protein kinase
MDEPVQFGRYTVKGLLGRGSMGVVYHAEDPVISRQVAIKVVHVAPESTDEDTAEFQRRFEREFRAAGTLSHPGIVTVYDVGQEDDEVFMAMEFIEGKNVEEQIGAGVEFSTEQVADLADQIGSALDYAHSQDVVHRDVKPANIMAATDGRFKLADFGIAKFKSGTLTRDGAQIGTPSFMSPEQVLGKKVTGASDQFSLGVVVYRLLTGQRPFTGESMTAVMYQISQVDPPQSVDPRP